MLLHAKHASSNNNKILISNPDTDAFVICLYVDLLIDENLFFLSGVKSSEIMIDVTEVGDCIFKSLNCCEVSKEILMKSLTSIANQNTTDRYQQDKTKKDIKSTLQPLEVGDRVLVRNLTPREESGKPKSFREQKVYIIEEVKDPDGSVYTVREQDKPNNKSRTLHRNNTCHTWLVGSLVVQG